MKLLDYLSEKGMTQVFFSKQIRYTRTHLNNIITNKATATKKFKEIVEEYTRNDPTRKGGYVSVSDWEESNKENEGYNSAQPKD